MRISLALAKPARPSPFTRRRAAEFQRQSGATEAIVVRTSGVARRSTIEKVLFPPFRPGAAHVVILRPIDLVRPIPGRAKKRQHGADDFAQQGNKNGCGKYHVTSHAKS
jgi:hypothetical protein